MNSKQKGNRFEREVAKILTSLFKNYCKSEFKRVPNSGSYLGGKNKEKNKNISKYAKRTLTSDLIVPEDFRFAIETKHYKNINLYNLLVNSKHIIYKWIDEIENTINNQFDGWIIIFKQNRGRLLVIVEEKNLYKNFNNYLKFNYKNKNYFILNFLEYFQNKKFFLKK